MAAKLIVTPTRGGSRIALIGASGTELLSSKVFTEPRGKGATLRALKGLLGEGISVDDRTTATAQPVTPASRAARPVKTARVAPKPARRARVKASK